MILQADQFRNKHRFTQMDTTKIYIAIALSAIVSSALTLSALKLSGFSYDSPAVEPSELN